MVVYVDLVFLTNVFFDTAIVVMTAKVRGLRIRIWRTAVAVLLGATYVIFMFEPSFTILYTAVAKLIFSLIVVYIAFGFGSLQVFFNNAGAFYLVHFASAGAIFAVHFLLLSSGDVMNRLLLQPSGAVLFAIDSGLWLSFPVFVLSLLFFRSVFVTKARTDMLHAYMAQVTVKIGDVTVTCNGLIDTGNQLYDPLTRVPVLVMESRQWQDMLPSSWMSLIKRHEVDRIFAEMEEESFPWPDRLRLVPYRSVNGKSQFMLAIKPDKVIISSQEQQYEQVKVLVALDSGTLTAGGEYQAIVHPMLVQ